MCFVIAIIALVLAVQFALKSLYIYAILAGITALVFIALMVRNIYKVNKERLKKDTKDDN